VKNRHLLVLLFIGVLIFISVSANPQQCENSSRGDVKLLDTVLLELDELKERAWIPITSEEEIRIVLAGKSRAVAREFHADLLRIWSQILEDDLQSKFAQEVVDILTISCALKCIST